mmetsp:Transcript_132828/g.424981  ORF Transcript_132828/g.424981 Transcript_132828/m.424981 type:complete len:226 (+) Transcript_132828:412-1089(+)
MGPDGHGHGLGRLGHGPLDDGQSCDVDEGRRQGQGRRLGRGPVAHLQLEPEGDHLRYHRGRLVGHPRAGHAHGRARAGVREGRRCLRLGRPHPRRARRGHRHRGAYYSRRRLGDLPRSWRGGQGGLWRGELLRDRHVPQRRCLGHRRREWLEGPGGFLQGRTRSCDLPSERSCSEEPRQQVSRVHGVVETTGRERRQGRRRWWRRGFVRRHVRRHAAGSYDLRAG